MSTQRNNSETTLPAATGYDPSLPAEEQYAHWILHLEQKREAAVKGVTAMLWEDLSRRASRPEVTTEALCRSIRAHLRPVFLDDLLPECASWTGREATPLGSDDIAGLAWQRLTLRAGWSRVLFFFLCMSRVFVRRLNRCSGDTDTSNSQPPARS